MMSKFLISCKESRIETNRSFYSSFVIGPFHASESITVATALRRSLLAELSGIAIVSVQIEGAAHEYSNLPGIRDSVLDILLNLREIVLKKSTNTIRPQIGYLCARGPGNVVAGDLILPPFIQCVDSKQHIATLADDGVLNMKFIIAEGKNYIKGKPKMMININQFKKRRLILKKLNQLFKQSSLLKKYYNYLKTCSANNKLAPLQYSRTNVFLKKLLLKKKKWNKKNFSSATKIEISKIKKNSLALNLLNVDAVFNPVLNVNYIIEINEHKMLENLFAKTNLIERHLSIIQAKSIIGWDNQSLEFSQENLRNQLEIIKLKLNQNFLKKLLKYQLNLDLFFKNQNTLPFNLANENLKELMNLTSQSFNETDESEIESNKIWSNDFQKDNILSNNIILEVWTNGSLHPREAVYEAFKYLIQLFSKLKQIQSIEPLLRFESKNINFIQYSKDYLRNKSKNSLNKTLQQPSIDLLPLNQSNFLTKYGGIQTTQIRTKAKKGSLALPIVKDYSEQLNLAKSSLYVPSGQRSIVNSSISFDKLKSMDISNLKIPLRTLMILKQKKINFIYDLIKLTKKDLLDIPYIGQKAIQDIEKSLFKIGFSLKEENNNN